MNFKKLYGKVIIGVTVPAILLAGCSSGDEQASEGGATGDKIVIDIMQGKVEIKNQFDALAAIYEEENPGVEINMKAIGGGSDYPSALKAQIASGDIPEIFSVAGPVEVEQFKEYLTDLSDTEVASLALEGTLEPISEGEEVYGLPFNLEGYGYIYNKEVFEQAGINPEEIKTYEDLETAVKKLDNMKEELELEAVFALPAKEKWVMGNHLASAYLAPEFNGSVLEANNANSVAFERGDELQRMLDLQSEYSVQPVLSLDYSQQVEEYFSLGRVAIIQQGNWIYPSVEEMDPEFAANNIGILPIPVEGFEGKLPVGVPNYWAVNSKAEEEVIEEAKKFLDWLYTSEAGKEAVLTDFKFIPAYEGFDATKIADPLSQEIYNYSSAENTIGWVFLGYPPAWGDVLGANMQKYIGGEATWEEVLEESRSAWEAAR